jgi:hypothetical protein
MKIFDLYRYGYALGKSDASLGRRRLAAWELIVKAPLSWLPGMDASSMVEGYQAGFRDAVAVQLNLQALRDELWRDEH